MIVSSWVVRDTQINDICCALFFMWVWSPDNVLSTGFWYKIVRADVGVLMLCSDSSPYSEMGRAQSEGLKGVIGLEGCGISLSWNPAAVLLTEAWGLGPFTEEL